jgi:hypothetical protein
MWYIIFIHLGFILMWNVIFFNVKVLLHSFAALAFVLLIVEVHINVWDVGSSTRRDNHVNFHNIHLLLLEAECAVTDEVLWGPEKGRNSKAGCA